MQVTTSIVANYLRQNAAKNAASSAAPRVLSDSLPRVPTSHLHSTESLRKTAIKAYGHQVLSAFRSTFATVSAETIIFENSSVEMQNKVCQLMSMFRSDNNFFFCS